ncbi:carboxypeptidase-like regulatory domain-containing protein [Gaetbulibacter saemankumensis]|uniref:carboxypeptidase-like regulatory domain-containing protein n=1 Tax=Gaetbulibacter saemankumensis TaxID=311208 RepID=UPI00042A3CC2|nr:carboxypeptidase-like regulatory domain-containing protein [Gaetbulibacter saemankumensis]
MRKTTLLIFTYFYLSFTFCQSVTGKIIDKATNTPIKYASVQTGDFTGVISNEEGYFSINQENPIQILLISCLGYQSQSITLDALEQANYTVTLEEAINELSEVYITNNKPNADSIITKVIANKNKNYNFNLKAYNIFSRRTDHVKFKNLGFEIEKATHVSSKNRAAANKKLSELSSQIRKSNMVSFLDFKGTLFYSNQDSSKLQVNKATKLLDYDNDFSIEDIQEKAQHIVLKYLDTSLTYKLKTGIFKIEDSLSLKQTQRKKRQESEYKLGNLRTRTHKLTSNAHYYNESFLNKILDLNLYNYEIEDINFHNEQLTYVIKFTPRKGKAKYQGKLYVIDDAFAISRIDFTYGENKHGQKINLKFLLGIKYEMNTDKGIIIYQKQDNQQYIPKYIKHTTGSYFYINRDIKFIENSEAKNKTGFNITIEGQNRTKEELLFNSESRITEAFFKQIKQQKDYPLKSYNKFEKSIWQNEQTLEPLEEMKSFGND